MLYSIGGFGAAKWNDVSLPDDKPVLKAKVIGSAINEQGRPRLPQELEALIARKMDAA